MTTQTILNPDLHRLAEKMGLKLARHSGGPKGFYHHPSRTITTRRGLSIAEYRSTLAHELGHAYYSDEPTPDPVRDARQEARANRWAANLLLAGQDVEKALICNGNHIKPAAYELEVTATILRVWLEMQKKGP